MRITVSAPLLMGALLLFARVAGVIGFVPLPYLKGASALVRIALAVLFTLVLLPVWLQTGSGFAPPDDAVVLVFMILGETTFGLMMGVLVGFLCEVFGMAAQFLGLQAGYGYASTIDPNTEADSGVLLVLAQLGGWMLFLALGVDRFVYQALARSIEAHPIGATAIHADAASLVIRFSSAVFSTAWRLALPVIALLLLVDLALAAFGRLHAQLQLLSMAFPAKMLMAIGVLGLAYRTMAVVFEGIAKDCGQVLYQLAGG